jgi:hypothetical protein
LRHPKSGGALRAVIRGWLAEAIGALNNKEHYADACALVDAAYVEGPDMAIACSALHTFRIFPVVVVAAGNVAKSRKVRTSQEVRPSCRKAK